jgi:hypothetical protein
MGGHSFLTTTPPAGTGPAGNTTTNTGAHPMTAAEALTARIEALNDDQIRDVMCGLMADFRPESDIVFAACMKVAEARMSSALFLALCGELEAAA